MDVEITIKNYRCFSDEKPARLLLRNGFTAFVGPNNSGKSSLLKFFYEFRQLFAHFARPGDVARDAFNRVVAFSLPSTVQDTNEIFSNLNNRNLQIELRFSDLPAPPSMGLPYPNQITFSIPRAANTFTSKLHVGGTAMSLENRNLAMLPEGQLSADNSPVADLSYVSKICRDISESIYIGSFRNALNIGARDNYFDIQVGDSFIKNWRARKNGPVKRWAETVYSLTDNIKQLFRFTDLQIDAASDETALRVFLNGKSFRDSELGAGLTQFILVLGNAALREPAPSYILIDEPELSLHPSLQLDFLTTLGAYAQTGVLFATHSIGLARSSGDSIYSLQQNPNGESVLSDFDQTPNLPELLGELNFSGYRELGFDKVLLVEGPSEVKAVQQFLRLYKKDHEILPLQLGGDSLINGAAQTEYQLEEIKRISPKLFALIDSERDSASAPSLPNRQAFENLCRKMNIDCHVLENRAMENYFPDRAVKKVLGNKYRGLQPFDKLKDVHPSWGKAENWRIAREMTRQELEATDLGQFLTTRVLPN